MTASRNSDTRRRLLQAAADMIAASPGQDVPVRAICERVGVKPSAVYHFFGSKQGLLDAVVDHGFDLYLGIKHARESSGDPLADIRAGWDAHVAFGLANPGFYALMYGQVVPGAVPAAQRRATDILSGLVAQASARGRLSVPAEQAVAHILAANVGVTLRLIATGVADPRLSDAMREATLHAITHEPLAEGPDAIGDAAARLLGMLRNGRDLPLRAAEAALLGDWLSALAARSPAGGDQRPSGTMSP